MGSKPDKVKAPKMNIGGDISQYVSGMSSALPQMLNKEAQFRPQFQGLNLQDISAFLGGVGGQQGLYGLSQQATQQAQSQLGQARGEELSGMIGQAPLVRQLSEALSPEAAAQVQAAQRAAQDAYKRNGFMSPQEERDVAQQSRQAYGARGMLDSTGSVASELLNRDAYRNQKAAQYRQEAAQRGNEAFSLAQSFYTAPGLSALSQAPMAYQVGQQQLGLGLGAIGAGTPQLFDPSVGMNLGAANRQNILAAQQANAQNQASYNTAMMGMIGSLGGAAIGAMKPV